MHYLRTMYPGRPPLKNLFFVLLILFLTTGTIAILIGTLFKIQHWDGGSKLLTIGMIAEALGLLCLAGYVILNQFRKR